MSRNLKTVIESQKLEDGNQQNSLRLNVFIFLKTCSHFLVFVHLGVQNHIYLQCHNFVKPRHVNQNYCKRMMYECRAKCVPLN